MTAHSAHTQHELKVRNVHFEFDEVPKHWILNSAVATHFINSMHIVFPEGEKFFIRSVRRFTKDVKSAYLKKEINSFCGQEGVHAREHQRFWEVMEEQKIKPLPFANFLKITAFSGEYSYENLSIKLLNKIQPRLGDKFALSVTTALEHYTAILANALFYEPLATNKNIAPQMLEMLHWHASEEIEHKAIPFDVLKKVDDSYTLRIGGMLIATWGLWFYLIVGTSMLTYNDKDVKTKDIPKYLLQFLTRFKQNFGGTLAAQYWLYYRKDFHPDQIDNYHLAEELLAGKNYA